jgi:hypothetical protein
MTIGHYIRSMTQLADQFTPSNFRDPKRQRLYLKDIDCPEDWANELKGFIPETFFYLNDCIEPRTGGEGAILEPNEYGQMKYGKGVAPSGDLMSSLPPEMRALNMMCYIGHEGTYTPAHREMCASLGHNIMVEASQDRNGEKAGSSIWFMTETKEREVVSEYFLSMLGHDIEVEKHFAQVNAWKKAPFNVWVVEQKPGDLILIPPLAPHQVWNRGTRTMKAAWNRTTVDTLELALHEALPRARLVCREEQYKNKAIIYFTLIKYHDLLQRDTIEPKMWRYGRIKQVLEDFKRLFALYTEMLVSEMFAPMLPAEQNVEFLPYDSNVTCSYCRCNIFNRFLTCKTCIETAPTGEEDTYDICMECYAMGRSCGCISNFNWVEQWDWSALTHNYEEWRNVIVQCDGYFDIQKSPQPLDVARKRYGKKPVAHICQEQLKIRPWHDISKPFVPDQSPGASDVEPEADDEGRPKKKTPRKARNGRVSPVKDKTYGCHVCCHHDWKWRLAFCTTCSNAYCYGVLWRGFDLMPQTVMEDRDWSCPKCQGICSCGKCRKNPAQKPYAPKGTLLGHDTKKVADFRSAESLVDFSKTNLGWLRGENDHNPKESARMKRLREKAEEAKAREDVIDENYLDHGDPGMTHRDIQFDDDGQIDPQLRLPTFSHENNGAYCESPYPSTNPATGGDSIISFSALEAVQSQHVSEAHLDIDAYIRPETSYPLKILSPVTLAHTPEQQDHGQAHLDQSRMMGIGYYKQGNGVDKILYDPPIVDGVADEPQTITVSTTANLALSDLLPQDESSKKRKHGSGASGVDETEFFTSKRQKKLAVAKRSNGVYNEEQDPNETLHKPTRAQRPSRLSVGKSHTYEDLGDDMTSISDSETVVISARNHEANSNGNLDAEHVKQITHRLRQKSAGEHESKRRSTRRQASARASWPIATKSTKIRSAWLDPEEIQKTDVGLSVALPKRRGRPPRSTTKDKANSLPHLDVSYVSDDDGNSGNSPSGQLGGTKRVQDRRKWNMSKNNPNVASRRRVVLQEEKEYGDEKAEVSTIKRRGRLQKSDSISSKPADPTQLLSLMEKLAQKGQSAKIVASKLRTPVSSSMGLRNGQSILSPANASQTQSASTGRISTNNTIHLAESGSSKSSTNSIAPAVSHSAMVANGDVQISIPVVNNGHTIVRLSLPSDLVDESEESGTIDSSSDDDSSIPAVRPSLKLA